MNKIDRERFGEGSLPPWVHHEHQARWQFASSFVSGKTIADCACGTGLGTKLFASSGATRVHSFDISPEGVSATRTLCESLPNVSVTLADGRDLPLEAEHLDVFISFETIEHITQDKEFLAEISRVLKADGLFICSTPNRNVTMPGKDLNDPPWNPYHVREYSKAEFEALLGNYFAEVAFYGQNLKSRAFVSILGMLGRLVPGNFGGRLNSALKLPRFLYSNARSHQVVPYPAAGECEYLVAVCRAKKTEIKH
jgi:ubiquinone/menaquinone biosynthesis C-methylase UbiE